MKNCRKYPESRAVYRLFRTLISYQILLQLQQSPAGHLLPARDCCSCLYFSLSFSLSHIPSPCQKMYSPPALRLLPPVSASASFLSTVYGPHKNYPAVPLSAFRTLHPWPSPRQYPLPVLSGCWHVHFPRHSLAA